MKLIPTYPHCFTVPAKMTDKMLKFMLEPSSTSGPPLRLLPLTLGLCTHRHFIFITVRCFVQQKRACACVRVDGFKVGGKLVACREH